MQIEEVTRVDEALVAAFARLLPQLDPGAAPPARETLQEIADSPTAALLVAREAGAVVGSLTLVWFRIPAGMRFRLEDVVVDTGARGRGIGEALVRAGLERARRLGAERVDLTSRPTREAANRLYPRLGFVLRDTNAYRYTFLP